MSGLISILEVCIDIHTVCSFSFDFHMSFVKCGMNGSIIHHMLNISDSFCGLRPILCLCCMNRCDRQCGYHCGQGKNPCTHSFPYLSHFLQFLSSRINLCIKKDVPWERRLLLYSVHFLLSYGTGISHLPKEKMSSGSLLSFRLVICW